MSEIFFVLMTAQSREGKDGSEWIKVILSEVSFMSFAYVPELWNCDVRDSKD